MVLRYVIVSVASGLAFGFMDGLINANPLAKTLLAAYKPIMKKKANFVFGMIADLAYGFALAGLFLVLYATLPGTFGLLKGLSFGVIVWFLRVAMAAATTFVMFDVPGSAIFYQLATGLAEMLVLGTVYGLAFAQP